MPLKTLVLVAFLIAGTLLGRPLRAEELNVYLKTTPRPELLRPFIDATDLSLLVTGSDGKPVNQGTVSIKIEAPQPGSFFSTDYPLIEGTLLAEFRLPLVRGQATWRYLFPIRGAYRLIVDATVENGRRASRTLHVYVRENRIRWLALAALSIGLIGLGFAAGRVFTGTHVGAIVLTAAALTGSAEVPGRTPSPPDSANLQIGSASVGRPSELYWSLAGGKLDGPRTLSLTITHLEKQKTVFAVEKIPVEGEWAMKFHFPDGAEYRVAAVAQLPGKPPVTTEQVIAVAAAAPPAGPMVRALAYFLALTALGLAIGRWSKGRGK